MTPGEIVRRVSITLVYKTLLAESGVDAPPLRGRRGTAFWRGGDGYNVLLNDDENIYFDHARSEGGGVLSLVQTVRRCSKQEALIWIARVVGIDLTLHLRARERRQRARADLMQAKLLRSKDRCLASLECAREHYFRACGRAFNYLADNGREGPLSTVATDVLRLYRRRYREIDEALARIRSADIRRLGTAFLRLRRQGARNVA